MAGESRTSTSNPRVVLDEAVVHIPWLPGATPGEESEDNPFDQGFEKPSIEPRVAVAALASSGTVISVFQAYAQGAAGVEIVIVPRKRGRKIEDMDTLTGDAKKQADKLRVLLDTGFWCSDGRAVGLRSGFARIEADRFTFAWGAVGVKRSVVPENEWFPPPVIGLEQFDTGRAKFTKRDKDPTWVPIPVVSVTGEIIWTEVPHYFRKIAVRSRNGVTRWYKQFGDWRSMDSRTGKYSTGNRRVVDSRSPTGYSYNIGSLPPGAVPATEVAHFDRYFPGAEPYGMSGWHAELDAIKASDEHGKLLLDYLKSGVFGIIIAAADRPFDDAKLKATMDTLDTRGRGRKGMAAFLSISLVPVDTTKTTNPMMMGGGTNSSAERGRIIFHEMSTKLPDKVLTSETNDALADRISQSERIPKLLAGRSDGYNFATAQAAWFTTNRLVFQPCHEEHDRFMERITVEMGVSDWALKTVSPDWDDKPPINNVAAVAGQYGGLSINGAMQIMGLAMDYRPALVDRWWGELPMPIVNTILQSPDPYAMYYRVVGPEAAVPRDQFDDPAVEIKKRLDAAEAAMKQPNGGSGTDPTGVAEGQPQV